MQVSVTCPDLGFAGVSVTAGVDSLVSEVLTMAAGEWDVDPDEVELSFAGDVLCESERITDCGVGADGELEMREKQFRLFGKCWFVDDAKLEKLLDWLKNHNEEYLYLDIPAFTEDGCISVKGGLLPSDAERISFRNSNSNSTAISQVTDIGNYFLSSCSQITSLDLSGLSSVTTIGNDFLYFCSQITSLDLSSFSSVTTIGNVFLYSCSKITSLDLSGLSSVTTIGNEFLYSCSKITSLDLSSLSSVTTIGNHFLYSCSKITSLDLSSLSSVTTIGNYFLCSCSEITSLDISSFSSVTTIGNGFLYSCSKITSLDLSGLSSVTTIGNHFLSSCSKITSLDLSSLGAVTKIGNNFLCPLEVLETVRLPVNNEALFEEYKDRTVNVMFQ